jgi:hypothetical protein
MFMAMSDQPHDSKTGRFLSAKSRWDNFIFRAESGAKAVRKNRWLGRILLGVTAITALAFAGFHPPPGVAVAVAAGAVAAMTILEMKETHKLLWLLLVLILVGLEIRGITLDHKEQDAKFNDEQQRLNDQFSAT